MSDPQRPRVLFFGVGSRAAGAASVLRDDFGTTDDGTSFEVLLRSNAIVPARPADEVICYATYLSIGHQTGFDTPVEAQLYVDDHPPLTHQFVVPAAASYRLDRYEIGWSDPVVAGDGRVARAPRGHRVQLAVRIPALACGCGVLDLEGAQCEVEVRTESTYPQTGP